LTTTYAGTTGTGISVGVPSGQGTGIYVVIVQLSPAACQVINIYTGASTGSGAWASTATGTWDTTCRQMRTHDSFVVRDGTSLQTSKNSPGVNCGNIDVFIQIGTLHAVPCTATTTTGASLCEGHNAYGWHNEVIISNPFFFVFAPLNAGTVTPFAPFGSLPTGSSPPPANCQNHFSWRNATVAETQPVIASSSNNNFQTSGSTSTWSVMGQNEVIALFPNGSTKRFGHNFILGQGSGCPGTVGPFDPNSIFQAQDAIGVVSQDGRLWEQTTSMLGQLGKDAKGAIRSDIFVWLLQ
jgi:hypothetical protein